LAAGMVLGWTLACRPTNLVLALAAAAGATGAAPRRLWPIWVGGTLVLAPTVAALFILEPLYLTEAARFIHGHATIWGNTALAGADQARWAATLAARPLLAAVLLAGALAASTLPLRAPADQRPVWLALAAAFWGHAIWIAGFQNPDNLRHLAPLLVLGGCAIGAGLCALPRPAAWAGLAAVMALHSAIHWHGTAPDPAALPPLQQAAAYVEAHPDRAEALLITNHGVEVMRAALPGLPVQDAYYTGAARLAARLAPGPVWRLSGTALPGRDPVQHFPGRFPGERDLLLYRLDRP